MKKYRVDIVVRESVYAQKVKYSVEAWLEFGAPEDALNLFFRSCKNFDVSPDPTYKMAWTNKEKERTSAVRFAIKLAEALRKAGFTTEGALVRKDWRGKLEEAIERKPQIEKLPGLSLSKTSMEIPKDLLKILKEKATEPI